jgi:hypothetical protein
MVSSQVTRDPGVRYGRYRVLQQTTGRFFVYDPSAPLAKGIVNNQTYQTLGEAVSACQKHAGLHPGVWDHD